MPSDEEHDYGWSPIPIVWHRGEIAHSKHDRIVLKETKGRVKKEEKKNGRESVRGTGFEPVLFKSVKDIRCLGKERELTFCLLRWEGNELTTTPTTPVV